MIDESRNDVAPSTKPPRVLALSGGVGGAKLALGLAHSLPRPRLMVVVNTADDFRHLGLHVSPDIDTLLYTLADMNNPDTGWGQRDESWSFMEALTRLCPDSSWFNLGDRDLATHLVRTAQLEQGIGLGEVTRRLAAGFDVDVQVVPMCEQPVRTRVQVDLGNKRVWLPFQEYFVKYKTQPAVSAVEYVGAEVASVPAQVRAALVEGALEAVVICPSNPYLSIDPILSVGTMGDLVKQTRAPVVAVSPLVGGRAIKGPTAKMMTEMGLQPDARRIAEHYEGIIDGLVLDTADTAEQRAIEALGIKVTVTNTIMNSLQDRVTLARDVLEFARTFANG